MWADEKHKKWSLCVFRHSFVNFVLSHALRISAFIFTINWHILNFTGAKTMALHPVNWKRTLPTHHIFEMMHKMFSAQDF